MIDWGATWDRETHALLARMNNEPETTYRFVPYNRGATPNIVRYMEEYWRGIEHD